MVETFGRETPLCGALCSKRSVASGSSSTANDAPLSAVMLGATSWLIVGSVVAGAVVPEMEGAVLEGPISEGAGLAGEIIKSVGSGVGGIGLAFSGSRITGPMGGVGPGAIAGSSILSGSAGG